MPDQADLSGPVTNPPETQAEAIAGPMLLSLEDKAASGRRTSVMTRQTHGPETFFVEIIKPSHYDDDGYVIQWLRAFIPSNSLACLYALTHAAGKRRVLGDQVDVVVNAYDESNTVIPVQRIIRRIQAARGRGLVLLAGVQTNQ